MKKFISLSILALLSAGTLVANDVSRSFFSVRPVQVPMARQNLLTDQARNQGRVLGMKNLQISAFGGASTNSDDLARYFMMGKTTLSVKNTLDGSGADESLAFQKDIQAFNFNIDTDDTTQRTFASTLIMKPRQTFYGASLSFRRPFRNRYWGAIETSLVHVRNHLHLDETDITAANATAQVGIQGKNTVANMIDAFKQDGMNFGKIDGVRTKTGIADLTLKIGYEPLMFNRNDMYMSPYLGVILPTGNKAEAVYMFEPIVGNGGHFGIMTGAHGEFDVCSLKSGRVWASYRIENQYLFQNTQKRTMDLKYNGAWSRYLTMFEDAAAKAGTTVNSLNFGTNIMTQDVHVSPGYFGNIDASFSYVGEKWNATLGYTVHARQGEEVKLKNGWAENASIASCSNVDTTTNPFRTIGNMLQGLDIVDTEQGVVIKESDIDFNSAAHPGGISQSIYASVGTFCPQHKERVFEAGASYEFATDNTGMDRVCGWIKAQISF
ncbi:hypothetical protein K9K77_00710 [Candidatus Babeliales bacterium]|nr:hypothetical protein [Candidatus Babeliales bacterium]